MRNSKKYFVLILAILLVVVMAFTLTCCNKKKQEQQKKQQEEEQSVEITVVEDFEIDDDGTLVCDVDNSKDKYSLKGKFSFKGGAVVKYFETPDGETLGKEITNLNVSLEEGDNIILVQVKNKETTKIYKINIYRQQHFTVSFETPQHEVASQTVLEGKCVTVPKTIPTQIGYTFDKWDFDFEQPIVCDTTIKSLWTANEYVITYDANGGVIYDADGVELEEYVQKVHYGEDVKFYIPYKEGYQFLGWYVENSRQHDGVWNGLTDKSFKAKWSILSLDVKVTPNLASAGEITGEGDYNYNTECTLTVSPYNGYRFLGWYKGEELISTDTTYVITLKENNVRLNAQFKTVREDMEPFLFSTDDEINYVVTGVRYPTLTEITVPDCVVGIVENALAFNALKSLTIPFIGTSIETAKQTKTLASMFAKNDVPETLTTIHVTGECYVNEYTFSSVRSLATLILDGVRRIEDLSFRNNQYLTKLEIGDSIEKVGRRLFYYIYNDSTYSPVNFTAFNEYSNGIYIGNAGNPYAVLYKEKVANQTTCNIHQNTKAIASHAFNEYENSSYWDMKQLSATLPAGLNGIGDYAFYYRSMTLSSLPSALKYIGGNAFNTALRSGTLDLTFGDELEEIGGSAFQGCSAIKSVVLPDSLTSLGGSAFYSCSSLSSVSIGKGLKTIRSETFGSSGISSVTISDNVETIESNAFDYCTSLSNITIGKGLKTVSRESFYLHKISTITISADNENLYGTNCVIDKKTDKLIFGTKTAVLPEGLKEIGENAFNGIEITSITIPATVTKIGYRAFCDCDYLTSVTFAEGSGLKEIEYNAFYSCNKIQSISLPDGVETLGDYVFGYCPALKTVSLPDSLKKVGESLFISDSNVEYTVEDNVKYLGNAGNPYAFVQGLTNTSLSTVTFKDGVKCVDMRALSGCSYITSLTIPNEENVDMSFLKNASFTTTTEGNVNYRGTTTNPYYYVSGSNSGYSSYTIHSGAKIIGNSTFNNRTMTSVTIPSSVEEIGNNAFQYCNSLRGVYFGSGSHLKKIGNYAFQYCSSSSFTSITIPASVEEIGDRAFYECYYLNNVNFESGSHLKKIGYRAFYGCGRYYYSTSDVTIPASVEEIGEEAFRECYYMNVSFASGSSLKKIGMRAFYNCDRIYSITIPASVEEIGDYAFRNCDSLNAVYFEEGSNLKTMGSYAFAECYNMYQLTLASGMEVISDDAFYYCYHLGNVTIPASVKKIGNYAFCCCHYNMRSVTIEEGVEEIGEYAFQSCYALQEVTIPVSVKSIGRYAFAWSDDFESINYAGTISQWYAIAKGDSWGRTGERFTVHCSDGNIRYKGN